MAREEQERGGGVSEQMYRLDEPCSSCGDHAANIRPVGDHQCAYCATCGKYRKNVPKADLGLAQRSKQTGQIRPAQRHRILERDNHTCWSCGRSAPYAQLEVDHIIPRSQWHQTDLPDAYLNDDRNLRTLCDQCNSGKSDELTIGAVRALIKNGYAA
jgi:5-methylcytosine-specific restriction endonuclease McrA